MKGMRKIVRGSGFRGALDYVFGNEHGDDKGQLIGGNMSGTNPRELAKEFAAIRELRPDIQKPVWHNSLRLPKGEHINNGAWVNIADDYMNQMGFEPEHQRAYLLHDDAKGQHIHIIASRVSLGGKIYLGKNENLKSTREIAKLEHKYSLTITPAADLDEDNKVIMPAKKQLKKGEIEQALRTGNEPAKQKLQRLIDLAKKDNPDVIQFVEKLETAGVTAIPNVAKTGKMNGFSFEIDGIAFKASQLGKQYAWQQLNRDVNYEQDRHSEQLRQHKERTRNNSDSQTVARHDREATASADNRADTRRHSYTDTAPSADTRQASEPAAQNPEQPKQSSRQIASAGKQNRTTVSHHNKDTDRPGSGATVRSKESAKEKQDMGSSIDVKSTVSGAYDRVTSLVPEAYALTKSHSTKLKAWTEQANALDAESYRITLKSRRNDKRTYNLGKSKDGNSETFYSAADVAQKIPFLSSQNYKGYDIYITPIDQHHHYLVIDDMQSADAATRQGYSPALVQSSSKDNWQAVIKTDKQSDNETEQQQANKLVGQINQKIGDPKFSGVVHPFRMAGFSNKKQGKDNFFTRIIDAAGGVCNKASKALETLRAAARQALEQRQKEAEQQKAVQAQHERMNLLKRRVHSWDDVSHFEEIVRQSYRDKMRQVKQAGWVLDLSRVDFAVAQDALRQHVPVNKLVDYINKYSPNVNERHGNSDYIARTIQVAIDRNALEMGREREADTPPLDRP